MKITAVTFILGSLAMMGIFPFSGFWSKDEILTAAFSSGNYILFGVGILTAMITAIFMTKLVTVTFFGEKRYHAHPHESPAGMTVPLIVLAVFAVFIGLAGLPGLDPNFSTFISAVAGSAAAHAGEAGAHAEHHFSYFVAITSTIAVFIGIAIGWTIYSKKAIDNVAVGEKFSGFHKALQNRLYIDHFYDRVIVAGIYNNIARVFNFIEVYVIIHFILNGTAYVTRQVGKGLRLTISGQLQHYAFAMVGGVLVLMIIFVLL
jgi:NADH-quinone oxidoreductase subunit L